MLGHDFNEPDTYVLVDSSTESKKITNDKLKISYNDVTETLELSFEGTIRSSELRNVCQLIVELVKQHDPVKWLLDLHNTVKIKRSDRRWAFTKFFPEMLRMAGKDVFVAIILPVYSSHELVQELEGDELMQDGNFMIINHFLYKKEAERWLEMNTTVKSTID